MNQQLLIQNLKEKKVHFIGISGIGMSALARYFNVLGANISGSDKESSSLISELKNEGIKNIWIPHNSFELEKTNPDFVVFSTAVPLTNEELVWAKKNNKNILHRSDLLQIAIDKKKSISISGTHGKTTTSAMVAEMLIGNNFDPSVIIGGILLSKGTNAIVGKGDYFVIEADESDKSHLKGDAEIALITNIEADHLENYNGSFEELKKTFIEFAKKGISNQGLVFCVDDKITREIISENFNLRDKKLISYGISMGDLATIRTSYNQKTSSWDIFKSENLLTSVRLKKPGKQNILNALAAFGVGDLLDIHPENIKRALESFEGVKRRFQILLKTKDIIIVDDYAHHPTEITETIKAAKELNPRRLIVVLQPHQPTRLKDLWSEFILSLKGQEDLVFVTDVYVARGTQIEGISSQKLVDEVGKSNVRYLSGSTDDIARYIEKQIKNEDLVLIMGAGDITNVGPLLVKSYERVASNIGNN